MNVQSIQYTQQRNQNINFGIKSDMTLVSATNKKVVGQIAYILDRIKSDAMVRFDDAAGTIIANVENNGVSVRSLQLRVRDASEKNISTLVGEIKNSLGLK